MSNFKEYVSSSAFRLDLSSNMIDVLILISEGNNLVGVSHWLNAENALSRRGLVKRVPADIGSDIKLTEEGVIVAELLRMAGYQVRSKSLCVIA